VNGVLGTDEHEKLIRQFGSAWWGWWKRGDEEAHDALLATIRRPFTATLISPVEEVQFAAQVQDVRLGSPPDLTLVPPYYRERAAQIPAWFELVSIEQVPFDRDLAQTLRRSPRTLLSADELREVKRRDPAATWEIESDFRHVVHLSDIHIGKDHNFALPGTPGTSTPDAHHASKRVSLVEAIKADLSRLKTPGLAVVIVSGDLVSRCNWNYDLVLRFFSELSNVLQIEPRSILFVPGNHDFYRQDEQPEDLNAVNYQHEMPYRGFWAQFHGTKPLEEINRTARIALRREGFDLVFGLLNSARWTSIPKFFEYGFVGKEKYKSVLDDMKRLNDRPSVRGLVLHHHLVPIQPLEQPGLPPDRPVSITLDATEIMRDAQEADVSIVLHGHQHRPDIVKVSRLRPTSTGYCGLDGEDVYVCAAGSSGSSELPRHQWNTYTLFEFRKGSAACRIRILDPEDNQHGDFMHVGLPLRIAADDRRRLTSRSRRRPKAGRAWAPRR
jgi:predicted MPP superfamily phosphohydrolase